MIIVELGPRDVAAGTVLWMRGDAIGEKRRLPRDAFVATIGQELEAYGEVLCRRWTTAGP